MRFDFSAGAFVYKKEHGKTLVLFLERVHGGPLDLPKGHLERGEDSEQAAKREIMEESGLAVDFVPYFKRRIHYFFRENRTHVSKTVTLFIADSGSKSVKISQEHSGYRWLDREQALSEVKYPDIRKMLPDVFEYIERYENISALNSEYSKLPQTLGRWGLSKTFVPGDGPLDAKTMVLGQAPGRNEDVLKKPFVGRSGKVLDFMLKQARLKRDKIYITSCVQFFPPENRLPTKEEVVACRRFLESQIRIIAPKNIILLGNLACSTMLGYDKVVQNHGKLVKKDGINYFITFHPAMALRSSKRVAKLMEEDFDSIGERVLAK
ncbi:MAG: NUDIX domain-containing protein [Candidatus Micrarchaeota archaeon]|nr:NUDIX domain-containing protein [Candidatus Micrarchaeota archaeon]MDE1848118.1 NUDIX domain-containing protein [Candidatus Micrarchaeota archaeon]MDE1863925.1 NUDIX domain-containing protein [Candidatus Micrarchaeota archaeon]